MKYAIQPVLKEIEAFVEMRNIDTLTPDALKRYLNHLPRLTGTMAMMLLLKLYEANKGVDTSVRID